jgi:hypothetical protein
VLTESFICSLLTTRNKKILSKNEIFFENRPFTKENIIARVLQSSQLLVYFYDRVKGGCSSALFKESEGSKQISLEGNQHFVVNGFDSL